MIYQLQEMPGFLGTSASWLTDFNLVAQIVIYLILCLGISAQRRQLYRWHDILQSFAVIANLFLIIAAMLLPALGVVRQIPAGLGASSVLVPTLHIVFGVLGEGLAIYCFLAGWRVLPRRIGQLRYWMWTAFIFWTAALMFGLGTYLLWYTQIIPPLPPQGGIEIMGEHAEDLPLEATEIELATPELTAPAESDEAGPEIKDPPIDLVDEHEESAVISEGEANTSKPVSSAIDPVLGVRARDYQLSQGWYQGRRTYYYEFRSNSPTTEDISQIIPAPIYAFITGFDQAENPQFLDGQYNIVNVIPTDRGYSDLWEVVFVLVPDDYEANSFTSAAEVLDSSYELIESGIYVNCPIVPADSSLAEEDQALVQGWYKGQEIYYFGFGNNILDTAPIYAFITGFNEAGTSQFVVGQNNVVDVIPDDESYSAFWDVNLVIVPQGYRPNTLRSVDEILDAGYEIRSAGMAVNYPIVRTEDTVAEIDQSDSLSEEAVPDETASSDPSPETGSGAEEALEPDLVSEPAQAGGDEQAEEDAQAEPGPKDTGFMLDQGTNMIETVVDRGSPPVDDVVEPNAIAITGVVNWNQVSAANEGPRARYEHAMQYNEATNQVFLFGGRDGRQIFNDVWVLAVDSMTWRQLALESPTAPLARFSTVMSVDEAGQNLYIATGHAQAGKNFADIWHLDLQTEIWTELSPDQGPTARYGGPGGSLGDGLVVTHGFGRTRYDDTWRFDPASGQWEDITPAGDLPLRRCLFAATFSQADLIIHGGCAAPFGDCFLDDLWVLDTATSAWREIESVTKPVGRQHHTLVAGPSESNQIILFGGQDASRTSRNDLWLLDLSTDTWQLTEVSDGPSARYNHVAVWIPDQGMLVHGGRDSGPLADMWLASLP